MTDRYERIRQALAMGPTPGPWKWWECEDFGHCRVNPLVGELLIAKCDVRNPFDPEQRANAALIAACDPDTIRALLEDPGHHGKPRSSLYSPVQAYADLWEQINGPESWAVNPWVWVIEFKMEQQEQV